MQHKVWMSLAVKCFDYQVGYAVLLAMVVPPEASLIFILGIKKWSEVWGIECVVWS